MVGLGRFLRVIRKKSFFAVGAVVAFVGLVSVVGMGVSHVSAIDDARECDSNAIVYCGFTSTSDLIKTVRANSDGNGDHDLQAIYAYYGLEPADYDKFVASSRPGTAYSDGRIVVDGQTVATNAQTVGRVASSQGTGYSSRTINGVHYYTNSNANVFSSSVTSVPVMVMFNSKGAMQFAVLNSCGSPEFGSVVTPTYSCDELQKTPVSGKVNTYTFTTAASAAHNATVAKVVYDFGDGSSQTITGPNSPSIPVNHTYTKPGTFTAKVTVYIKLPGDQQVTVTSSDCQTVITVASFNCMQLSGAFIDREKMQVSLVAKANFGGGATFTGADFNFDDGTAPVTVHANGNSATVTHTYSNSGTYNPRATLHFVVDGNPVVATSCAAVVTPTTPPTPECKADTPVGSPACLPPSSPVATTISKSEVGNTIVMAAVVIIAGFMVYRQLQFRKHHSAFRAAERGTSALPLGDPLNPDKPLAGTPLAKRKPRPLRRKR